MEKEGPWGSAGCADKTALETFQGVWPERAEVVQQQPGLCLLGLFQFQRTFSPASYRSCTQLC